MPPPGRHRAADSESTTADEKPRPRPTATKPAPSRTTILPPNRTGKAGDDKLPPPKVKAPDFSEWHDYFGNFALKWITRGYVAWVFRGVDRYELLSEQDNDALELDEQAASDIAKPLAHMANRSKLAKTYGRVIIDSSDGVAAFITLGMWMNRVNRIAKPYREGHKHEHRGTESEAEGGSTIPAESNGQAPEGASYRPPTPGFGYN
jgi:hypothetical protein